jgi:hypothetical protein
MGDANDTNYIFLRFVLDNLRGLIGLLIEVIFICLGIDCCLSEFAFISNRE